MVPSEGQEAAYAVTGRTAAEGSLLRAGTEVFKLVMDRTLKLKVPVPDRFVAEVQVGQKAKVYDGRLRLHVRGTVTRINPAVDPSTRTFEVEIQLPNANGALKSGSFAKAAIETRIRPERPDRSSGIDRPVRGNYENLRRRRRPRARGESLDRRCDATNGSKSTALGCRPEPKSLPAVKPCSPTAPRSHSLSGGVRVKGSASQIRRPGRDFPLPLPTLTDP